MPETYYYATGTEVTSIANAIRVKGGTSQALTFPDDFVQAIQDLVPQPVLTPLSVTPTKAIQTFSATPSYDAYGTVTVYAIPAEYITTTDATATASYILSAYTAYVSGSKITGNLVIQHYYSGSTEPSSSLGANGDIYLKT